MVDKPLINCRLCTAFARNGIEIFGKKGVQLTMAAVLQQHFPIQLSPTDKQYYVICKKCWRITDQFHKLYCDVERNQWTFQDKIPIATIGNELNIKEEVIDLKSDYNPNETPVLLNDDYFKLKVEAVGLDEILDEPDKVSDEDNNEGNEDATTDNRPLFSPGTGTECKKSKNHQTTDSNSLKIQEAKEDNEIEEILGIRCDVCYVKTANFVDLKKHFRKNHALNGYIRCCEKKFFHRTRLYNHILDHSNPSRYKCEFCDKIFVDRERLMKHLKRHDPSMKKLQCNQCPKRFEYQSLLDCHVLGVHRPIVDTTKSFICDICSKGYISKMSISSHMNTAHAQKYSQICDICARVFNSRKLLDDHYKTKHMGIPLPKHQCTVCGSWLSHITALKRHMRGHNGKVETCDICGKTAPNINALKNHMRYVHSGRIFQCQMCLKSFKSRISLKEHIGSHTGVYLYKCPYCSMEFKSGGNMHKHRKNKHPVEFQRDRDKREDKRLNSIKSGNSYSTNLSLTNSIEKL